VKCQICRFLFCLIVYIISFYITFPTIIRVTRQVSYKKQELLALRGYCWGPGHASVACFWAFLFLKIRCKYVSYNINTFFCSSVCFCLSFFCVFCAFTFTVYMSNTDPPPPKKNQGGNPDAPESVRSSCFL
jgi:apolipoprotein N-acyltransferase